MWSNWYYPTLKVRKVRVRKILSNFPKVAQLKSRQELELRSGLSSKPPLSDISQYVTYNGDKKILFILKEYFISQFDKS